MGIETEEHEPLLPSSDVEVFESNTLPQLDYSQLSTIKYEHPGLKNPGSYGSLSAPITSRKNLVYTWNDINVFTTESTSSNRNCLVDLFTKRCKGEADPQRKQILRSVSGEAKPGELMAIMGSSGAGKTTLLNTLTFRSGNGVIAGGYRALGGHPLTAAHLTALSAYVQQDDLFIGTLTVREHLIFQALVRMDRKVTYSQRVRRVNEVISELALTKCQNTVIGIPGLLKGISGGEMKRLSFASEVLTDPPLMFCDEPTSGLDSFMAQNVIQVLKGLAQSGKTVICTIHQPSSELYAMFDKLLLMAEGRVAFLGSPDEAAVFFSGIGAPCPVNYNPSDFYIQLLAVIPSQEEFSKETIENICDSFHNSESGKRLATQMDRFLPSKEIAPWDIDDSWPGLKRVKSPYRVSWWAQFRAVFWRSWISIIKEPMLIKVRFLQTIMVALLLGTIYFGQRMDQDGVMNINGAIFIFLTNMTFQNVIAVTNVFCAELSVFLREHRSGMYRTDVYFLCKSLAEMPVFAIIPVIFTSIAYFMIGMNPEPQRFFITAGVTILITSVATSFGYMMSCISKNISMALSIGPPLIIPFMLFGGFFLNSGSVPVYFEWLSNLSWFKYGNEALMINQWYGVENIACTRANSSCPRSGAVVLQTLNFSPDNFNVDIIALFALVVGFRLLAFLALLAKTYRSS